MTVQVYDKVTLRGRDIETAGVALVVDVVGDRAIVGWVFKAGLGEMQYRECSLPPVELQVVEKGHTWDITHGGRVK